ncbi:MAG: aminopeptidase [Magnetococcales bacterium]|nr:aminopeptidase [Magnetococcales bacterium]
MLTQRHAGWRAALPAVLWMLAGLLLPGCDTARYYLQAVGGEIDLLTRRRPVVDLLADPATPASLRDRLTLAKAATNFATTNLSLTPTGSFQSYVDLSRPYAVWSVYATPALSLEPATWCFPIIGCITYRGYFSATDAHRSGRELANQGMDTYVAGTPAFSTLGWFDDPLLNTYINWPEPWLTGLIFHEMAHATVYIPGDTTFNESYAEAVGLIGTERWLQRSGKEQLLEKHHRHLRRRAQSLELIHKTRLLLGAVYTSQRSPESKQAVKVRILAATRAAYRRLVKSWGGESEFARWFSDDLNNAQLIALTTYSQWVPAFLTLLAQENGSMEKFHQATRDLGSLPPDIRHARLRQLSHPSPPSTPRT